MMLKAIASGMSTIVRVSNCREIDMKPPVWRYSMVAYAANATMTAMARMRANEFAPSLSK